MISKAVSNWIYLVQYFTAGEDNHIILGRIVFQVVKSKIGRLTKGIQTFND